MSTLYTIGHSNLPVQALIDALRTAGVVTLCDVRRYPASRRNPWFNAGVLAASLREAGIAYHHFEALGGRREPLAASPNTALTVDAFRGYADYSATAEFDAAVTELLALAAEAPTAVMCSEAQPLACHRSLLADSLLTRGQEVIHLIGPTRRKHELTPVARIVDGRLIYPALL